MIAAGLIVLSLAVVLVVMEGATRIMAGTGQQIAQIPDEWARKGTVVLGARVAYYWHGALHILDETASGARRRSLPMTAHSGFWPLVTASPMGLALPSSRPIPQ